MFDVRNRTHISTRTKFRQLDDKIAALVGCFRSALVSIDYKWDK